MAILHSQPQNPNFLSTNKFRFVLQRAPNVVFFGVGANIPSISLDVATQPTPFIQIPRPGNKIHYEDYTLNFRVDEDMKNYLEVYNWMNDMGFPDDFSGYPRQEKEHGSVYSDASLIILTSKHNPNIEVKFRDMFPVALGAIDFSYENEEVTNPTCSVTFKYQRFYITHTT